MVCINCGDGRYCRDCPNDLGIPSLTKEQIKLGFHIWTEFELGLSKKIGFAHWKDCPCNKDIGVK